MYHYYLFIVEEEVYQDYFYKSGIIARFFKAYLNSPSRWDLSKQFMYITKRIPINKLSSKIKFETINERIISLTQVHQLPFNSKLISELELVDRHCFVVDNTQARYGWISPMNTAHLPINTSSEYHHDHERLTHTFNRCS
ncbi:Protein of unknown function [Amphibacillus marinus]|uniref:Sporulation inhibitor of replication protein SirA n=1 Tax=Amphibacillus marinus TaxID=872970 RepID=A0A1H8GYI0_9BACI|nr:sporulation inhibitor of replication protein SirA [Amphibacillus marinus]SEN48774.1 Protein of unknown function [Amphibacillus marinus]